MPRRLKHRVEAGRLLAQKFIDSPDLADAIVLGLPRGGVPVAFEIARKLKLPLDICLVRKLGVPGNEELAMGAIGMGGIIAIDEEVIDSHQITQDTFDAVIRREWEELVRRYRVYRGEMAGDIAIEWRIVARLRRGRGQLETPNLQPSDASKTQWSDKNIILVDDGVATGSTLYAALATLKPQQPKSISVALPIAPPSICKQLKTHIDRVECLMTPQPLHCIGLWYEDFSATSDKEVCYLLDRAKSTRTIVH
ncbi:phosphoribosyltransferase [Oscillatoriales cyanobacterium LEGE 11467]|uniref:Phosphoribosyltransferase n=1 Tax=Zarconia navalis LEGE 11467 TaxID=1828826 RepID=A0A928Z7C1_9CYAN|nr:phosphoribosyltransferase family protein [Zarconia navalis]MBE9040390.1 phosphoribosyltransferase [Zarconia navalis LEGE 11467]